MCDIADSPDFRVIDIREARASGDVFGLQHPRRRPERHWRAAPRRGDPRGGGPFASSRREVSRRRFARERVDERARERADARTARVVMFGSTTSHTASAWDRASVPPGTARASPSGGCDADVVHDADAPTSATREPASGETLLVRLPALALAHRSRSDATHRAIDVTSERAVDAAIRDPRVFRVFRVFRVARVTLVRPGPRLTASSPPFLSSQTRHPEPRRVVLAPAASASSPASPPSRPRAPSPSPPATPPRVRTAEGPSGPPLRCRASATSPTTRRSRLEPPSAAPASTSPTGARSTSATIRSSSRMKTKTRTGWRTRAMWRTRAPRPSRATRR